MGGDDAGIFHHHTCCLAHQGFTLGGVQFPRGGGKQRIKLGVGIAPAIYRTCAARAVKGCGDGTQTCHGFAGGTAPGNQEYRKFLTRCLGDEAGIGRHIYLGTNANAGPHLPNGLRDPRIIRVAIIWPVQGQAKTIRVARFRQ